MQKTLEQYDLDIADLERKLVELDFDMRVETASDISAQLQRARRTHASLTTTVHVKTLALGVDARNDLRQLMTSKFLQLRMNARALKIRIRQRLQERKFELERVVECYRNTANG